MHAAGSGPFALGIALPSGAGERYAIFSQQRPRCIDLKRLAGGDPLERVVRRLELAQMLDVVSLHSAVLATPNVKRVLGDAVVFADLTDRLVAGRGFRKHRRDLLFRELGFLHSSASNWWWKSDFTSGLLYW